MKHTPAGEAVLPELVLTGLVLGALLERAGDALAIPEGQTAARWRVLARASKTDMTVAEIARSLNQSRRGVKRLPTHWLTMTWLFTSIIQATVAPNCSPLRILVETP